MLTGHYKTSYFADEAIWNVWPKQLGMVLLIALLALFPFVANDYLLLLAGQIGIYLVAVTGVNILMGYTGLMSLGHGAFFALGAYTTVAVHHYFPTLFPLITLAAATGVAALSGFIFGLPSLRVKGLYLAVATLSANFLVLFMIRHHSLEPWTGGVAGIETPNAWFFGHELISNRDKYFLIVPLALALVLFAQNLFRARFGRALIAIRDQDYSAQSMGIPLFSYKLKSFALSAAYSGAAGGLWAYFFPAVMPEDFGLGFSITLVVCLVAGGLGRSLGPLFGTVLILLLPELLKVITSHLTGGDALAQRVFSPMRDMVFGLMIIGFLMFEPLGLVALWDRLWRFMQRWPFGR